MAADRTREGDVDTVIAEMATRIADEFDPERIILFGSRARGDAHPQSDVDLLVVMPDGTVRDVAVDIGLAVGDLPVAKDIIVTTPEEIARRGDVIGTVLRPTLREGTVIYERA